MTKGRGLAAERKARADARLAQIIELRRRGTHIKTIAREVGLAPTSVTTYLKRAYADGTLVPSFGRLTQIRPRMVTMHLDGASCAAIAETMGLSRMSVWAHLSEARRRGELPPSGHKAGKRGPHLSTDAAARAERNRKVAAMFREGRSGPEIAEAVGVSPERANGIIYELRQRGILPPAPKSETMRSLIEAMLTEGATTTEIERAVGCSESYVRVVRSRRTAEPSRSYTRISGSERAAILMMLRPGVGPTETARRLSLPISRVAYVGYHAGIRFQSGFKFRPEAVKSSRRQHAPTPFPITVSVDDIKMFAKREKIAWEGDRDSIARVNAVRHEKGMAPMWVHPRELRA